MYLYLFFNCECATSLSVASVEPTTVCMGVCVHTRAVRLIEIEIKS